MRRLRIGLILVSVLVAVFALTNFSFAARDSIPEEVIKASEYVVRIKITTFEKGRQRSFYNQGSGFFVAPNKVLTASHVGGSLKELFEHVFSIRTIEVEGKDYLVVEVVGIDFSRELALLEIGEDFPSYVLEFTEPEVGDEIYFVGFSGFGKRILEGKVSAIGGNTIFIIPKAGKEKLTFLGEVLPGMSGGPILDKQGRVVGLIWSRWVWATSIEEIKKFLEELELEENDDK